jgi:hypothetical protein
LVFKRGGRGKKERLKKRSLFDMSSSRHADALDMAEFKAIVTASFDDIGSHVALNNIRALHPNRLAPPSSSEDRTTTTTTRRSPLSFLRKVKSHATSLLVPQTRSDSAASSPSSRSFVPALVPGRQCQPAPAPAPFASSLSRNLLTRALGRHAQQHTPHFPDVVEPKSSFFDDDDDEEYDVECRRLFTQTRRISCAPARPNSRLSSAFAAAPTLFGLSSPSVSTPSLIPEKYGVVRPDSRADILHVCAYLLLDPVQYPDLFLIYKKQASKSSLKLKLRTKLSLPKLASPRSNLSSSSSDPSPVTPSYHSHPYSAVFADSERTHPCRASLGDRSITPDEDPFRKDEIVPYFLANSRLPCSSPRSGSLDSDSETDKHILSSRNLPMFSSRWSFDSDSSPSSHNHTPVTGGRPGFAPSPNQYEHRVSPMPLQITSRSSLSPLSLTFPLPPSNQKSASLPGVTVRVTTPTSGRLPAYPPPRTPPPSGPLPCPPPTDTSRARPSARIQKGVPRRRSGADSGKLTPTGHRSPLQMDQPMGPFLSRNKLIQPPVKERSDVAKRTQQKSAPRRRDRPVTPFPLLHPVGRSEPVTAGRLEASNMATRFTCPREESAFDQVADAIPDSETEPDRDFNVSNNDMH